MAPNFLDQKVDCDKVYVGLGSRAVRASSTSWRAFEVKTFGWNSNVPVISTVVSFWLL